MTTPEWGDLKRGDLVVVDGEVVQVGWWEPPLFSASWSMLIWRANGCIYLVVTRDVRAAGVLEQMSVITDNPFVWWKAWPKRLWRMVVGRPVYDDWPKFRE